MLDPALISGSIDVTYHTLGVAATIDGLASSFIVIDKTAGIDVAGPQSASVRVPTLTPAAVIRRAELAAAGVTDLGTLVGKGITFNGGTWSILASKPKPSPTGEAGGEVFLILRRAN